MLEVYFDKDDVPHASPLEDDEEVKLESEETIAARIKLNPQKKNNNRNRIKNFNCKQTIN